MARYQVRGLDSQLMGGHTRYILKVKDNALAGPDGVIAEGSVVTLYCNSKDDAGWLSRLIEEANKAPANVRADDLKTSGASPTIPVPPPSVWTPMAAQVDSGIELARIVAQQSNDRLALAERIVQTHTNVEEGSVADVAANLLIAAFKEELKIIQERNHVQSNGGSSHPDPDSGINLGDYAGGRL